MEWANLIVPSVISIIGFVVTYLSMCKQFKDSIKQQLTEEQRKVYLDTYVDVEKIVTTNEIIFEPQYYDELVSHKAIIKLAASNAVIGAYSDYMRFVFDVACPAWKWISANHPESCKDNFEYVYDEDGNEHEIAHITEDIFKQGEALEQHGHEVQYFGMEHEGRCVGNRVNAYTSDMDFHGGSKLSKLTYPIKTIYSKEARVQLRKVLDDFKPDRKRYVIAMFVPSLCIMLGTTRTYLGVLACASLVNIAVALIAMVGCMSIDVPVIYLSHHNRKEVCILRPEPKVVKISPKL